MTLGDDYLQDVDLADLPSDAADRDAPDRIDAAREELLVYIEARSWRRRRRAIKVGAVLLAVASVAVLVSQLRRPSDTDSGTSAASVLDSRLGLSPPMRRGTSLPRQGKRVATTMPAATGGAELVQSAYLDVRGGVCLSIAEVVRGVTQRESVGGCPPPRKVARAVARVPAFVMMSQDQGSYVLFGGLGGRELERFVPDDRRVRIESAISSTWHPGGGAGDFAVRTFLIRVWKRSGVRFGASILREANRRNLGLTAVLANGDKTSVTSYLEALDGEKPPTQLVDPILERMSTVSSSASP